jgi:uncharacterized 2Fe-2S/4Fe-4S cluster protein (DUF4445 family)
LIAGTLAYRKSRLPIPASEVDGPLRGCEVCLPESGEAQILVPARSLLSHAPQIVSSFRLNVPRAHDPVWQPLLIAREEVDPSLPLAEALCQAAAKLTDQEFLIVAQPQIETLHPAPDGAFHVCLDNRGDAWELRVSDIETAYGAAVDIGTTTVVVAIVEMTTGRVVGNASALNAQVKLGDNVLTRINLCMNDPEMIGKMQRAVIEDTLKPLCTAAAGEADVDLDQLVCLVIAGNMTMLHLLEGVDPSSMGVAPFIPTFLEHRVADARDWRLGQTESTEEESLVEPPPAPGHLSVHMLPGAAAYVGADITAGVLASGMAYRDETCLFVDIGTNGEIVLQHHGRLIGCATAAGPAFEGAGLKCGMRAGEGAISHIQLDSTPLNAHVEVIGDRKPIGICGTAYIDFVARARALELISPTARFTTDDEIPGVLQRDTYGMAFVAAYAQGKDPLVITEADMACLLQAKAAIAAGILCLLQQAGATSQQVDTVYIAGGFGFHMHVDSLLGCGLLPGFRPEQIQMVGNTSLAGAYLALLDYTALDEMRRISKRMEIVELNLDPQFEMTYIDQLSLP